jgi:prepilin-type N-terminal cleavage/methylation domain-containing protein
MEQTVITSGRVRARSVWRQTVLGYRRGKGRRQGGFTLIELLVVIIILALLATIGIPTFLGQRQKAHDAAAYTLVRNALTALQAALVDTGDYTLVTADQLTAIEPSIVWKESENDLVSTAPAWIAEDVGAQATNNEVAFYLQSKTVADLASRSESGNIFGIQVDTVDVSKTGYVKVKTIEGETSLGW